MVMRCGEEKPNQPLTVAILPEKERKGEL